MKIIQSSIDELSLENVTRPKLKKEILNSEIFSEYKGRQGFFIKTFFADDMFNDNDWGVTQESLERDIHTALDRKIYGGKTAPFILMPNDGWAHPDPEQGDILKLQEPHRVGNAIEAGIDEETRHAYTVFEIFEKWAQQVLQSGEISFISPSLRAITEIHSPNGRMLVTRFRVNHVAGVKDPAYGNHKAQIRGICIGEKTQCLTQLKNVQASKMEGISISQCKNTGKLVLELSAQTNECVQKWIKELSREHPDWPQDQIVAVAFSKCRESSGKAESLKTLTSNHKSKMPTDEELEELKQKKAALEADLKAANDTIAKLKQAQEETDEEKKKKKEMEEAAKQGNKEFEAYKKDSEARYGNLEAMLKKPLVEKIAQAQITIKKITDSQYAATVEGLMKKDVSTLQEMETHYSAMVADIEKNQRSLGKDVEVRYQYQASKDETDGITGMMSEIIGRMQ